MYRSRGSRIRSVKFSANISSATEPSIPAARRRPDFPFIKVARLRPLNNTSLSRFPKFVGLTRTRLTNTRASRVSVVKFPAKGYIVCVCGPRDDNYETSSFGLLIQSDFISTRDEMWNRRVTVDPETRKSWEQTKGVNKSN